MSSGGLAAVNRALPLYGNVFRAQADFARDVQSFLRRRLRELKPDLADAGIEIDAASIDGDEDHDEGEYAYWLSAWALVTRFHGLAGTKGDAGAYIELAIGWLQEPDGDRQTLPFALVEIDWSDAPRPAQWEAIVKAAAKRLPPLMYRDATRTYLDVMLGDEESEDAAHFRRSLDELSRDLDVLVAALSVALAPPVGAGKG
jgi:hypothetical protein